MAKRLFEPIFAAAAEDGVLGGLATGTGGGRYRDVGGSRPPVIELRPDPLQVVHHRIAPRQQARDRFTRIQHAATADTDHGIDTRAPQLLYRGVHHLR